MKILFLIIAETLTGWLFPAAFEYYSSRMMLAALTSFALSLALGPLLIRQLASLKIGQPIRKSECPHLGKLHATKENTPTMGGVLILFSMLVSLALWMDLSHVFTWILGGTTVLLGFVGGWDDYLKLKRHTASGMSARMKLIGQWVIVLGILMYIFSAPENSAAGVSALTYPVAKEKVKLVEPQSGLQRVEVRTLSVREYMSRLYIPFFKHPIWSAESALGWLLMSLFFGFVVLGSSNAVNLTDGLDGLASGCLVMVSAVLAGVAFVMNHITIATDLNLLYIEGAGEVAIYLCAMMGACLGFLWYNCHPADVFMGDTGSLALGGILGVSAVLLCREFLLGIVGGVFVVETLSVILQVLSYRFRGKKRIFLCAPLHHHYEYCGWNENRVVVRFWIVSLLCAIVGLLSLKFQ